MKDKWTNTLKRAWGAPLFKLSPEKRILLAIAGGVILLALIIRPFL
ncbi:MAG: hypothetical protein ACYTEQ_19285 [Planctomycetota bacterium]|jgi:hypothetical protein